MPPLLLEAKSNLSRLQDTFTIKDYSELTRLSYPSSVIHVNLLEAANLIRFVKRESDRTKVFVKNDALIKFKITYQDQQFSIEELFNMYDQDFKTMPRLLSQAKSEMKSDIKARKPVSRATLQTLSSWFNTMHQITETVLKSEIYDMSPPAYNQVFF